ncbi:hypothetical protein ATE84_4274 [Aquimarina sp. MAR_2010_214]|uniref:hypothetical protein n=1 Tax=Aquimarina sp. MAR_2010_214 TaxID=1250026 RepID=UPI000C7025D3|nr:hypothetical protein [Aquimarina sp. MAR_2010_214]PKV52172.1 hypothetical protein ATE84_4274 [Aquimarina sp. MAR_2010_214]
MKKIALILFLLCFIPKTNAQDIYDDALTAASYAYSHSKKAHGANNVFHTQEYADKAIEAFQKVEDLSDKCGCKKANETAYTARVDMESSLEQDTYERSRYFAKRAKELGSKLLEQLTFCQANSGSNYTDAEEASTAEENELAEATQEVASKQKELEEKRRQLELEQQKLEQQIAEQNKIKADFEAKRAAELKAQSLMKSKAETALQKLENALQELSVVLNEESKFESHADYVRSENDLKNESLDDTKTFYVNRAKELTQTAMQQFAGYNMVEN